MAAAAALRAVRDHEQAAAVVTGIRLTGDPLPLLGLPGSAPHDAAKDVRLPAARPCGPPV